MWRKELTLLLLTASTVLILGQQKVYLDNDKSETVSVSPGSSLTLICRLNTTGKERYRVNFTFDTSGPANYQSEGKHQTHLHEELITKAGAALNYTLLNFTEEKNGWYFCSIKGEIPPSPKVLSLKTKVIVAEDPTSYLQPHVTSTKGTGPTPEPPLPPDWWMWTLFSVAAVILIVLLIICIVLRRKYYRQREADPIYANTRPKQPSPRPGTPVNTLKKASSSQNVQHQNRTRRYEDGKRRHTP